MDISLALRNETESSQLETKGTVSDSDALQRGFAQKTVLVVDDEPSVQGFVARVLSRKGYHCLTAANASEAIAIAINETPDVTITDIRMPGSDGIGHVPGPTAGGHRPPIVSPDAD